MEDFISGEVSDEGFDALLDSLETPSSEHSVQKDIIHEFDLCQLQYHLLLQQFTYLADTKSEEEEGIIAGINELENTIESLRLENQVIKNRIEILNRELKTLEFPVPPPIPRSTPNTAELESEFTPRFSHHSRALAVLWNLHSTEARLKRMAFDTSFEKQG